MALSEIPRPKGSILSHSRRFVKNTMLFYEEVFRECGDIFCTRIPGLGDWVYICSPDLVQTLLEEPPEVIRGGDLGLGSLVHMFGEGATSELDGCPHLARRQLTKPYLSTAAGLPHVDEIRRITERHLSSWPSDGVFRLIEPLQRVALESLVAILLDTASPEKIRQFADIYQEFSFKGLRSPTVSHPTFQIDLGPWSPWGRVKKRREQIFAFLGELITERLASGGVADDDLMLGLSRASVNGGSKLTPQVIRSEILDLLFQGHEFTGNSLAWTLREVLQAPGVLVRLRAELDEVLGDDALSAAHLPELVYLDAVANEGLRFRPTSPFTSVRKTQQTFQLGGYELPEGTFVAVCFPALARREDIFAHPDRFEPKNFLGKSFSEYAWSPFGSGQHQCAGKDLAQVILKVALATIVRGVDLQPEKEEVRPIRNAYFYEPDDGFRATMDHRF